jgi:hypothetical protein
MKGVAGLEEKTWRRRLKAAAIASLGVISHRRIMAHHGGSIRRSERKSAMKAICEEKRHRHRNGEEISGGGVSALAMAAWRLERKSGGGEIISVAGGGWRNQRRKRLA